MTFYFIGSGVLLLGPDKYILPQGSDFSVHGPFHSLHYCIGYLVLQDILGNSSIIL